MRPKPYAICRLLQLGELHLKNAGFQIAGFVMRKFAIQLYEFFSQVSHSVREVDQIPTALALRNTFVSQYTQMLHRLGRVYVEMDKAPTL